MLLEEVRRYAKLDCIEDADILSTIERGKMYLERIIGPYLNFELDDAPKQLLLDYCRYSYNNAIEFFADNFAEDILRLSLQEGVRIMEESTSENV